MILTEDELREITRRERPAAQARVLRKLGIPFKAHPTDPVLLVDRDTARAALGANEAEPTAAPDRVEWQVNVAALRGTHGNAA